MTRSHRTRAEDGHASTDGSSSDSDEEPTAPLRSRPGPAKGSTSASRTPWVVGGTVVVVVAAIAAAVYILTRDGGGGGGAPTTAASSDAVPTPKAAPSLSSLSVGGTGVGKGGGNRDEEEALGDDEDEDDDAASDPDDDSADPESTSRRPRPTKSQGDGSPSPTSTSTAPGKNKPGASSSSVLGPLYGDDLNVDFTSLGSPDELEPYLAKNGLRISDYGTVTTIGPILHGFYSENVDWEDGALRLRVVGQTGDGEVSSGEFETLDKFLYGRVTTRVKATPVPGICHGVFWYGGQPLEVDIELLSSYYSKGRGDSVKPGLQLTNHPVSGSGPMTNKVVPYGFDPTEDYHDYTIEWKEDVTIFEVDGEEVGRLTENVPSEPMGFIWNSWSSGEPNWSAGPPTDTSYMLIAAIAANWTVAK
ncbi:hypothetical protein JCM11491_000729 [Sporobolomyces phaffii]